MIKLNLFMFIILCNYSFSQNIDLTKTNLEIYFKKSNEWYASNTDSSYFLNNSIWLQTNAGEVNGDLYVWKLLNRSKIGFYTFNPINAVSSPMRIGYKYKIYNHESKLFVEIIFKREIIEQFEVKQVIQEQTGNHYKIQMARITSNKFN